MCGSVSRCTPGCASMRRPTSVVPDRDIPMITIGGAVMAGNPRQRGRARIRTGTIVFPMPARTPALDFVVIGAQKGGTTTLFEHLRRHPHLCLPADKEAPFFNRPELFSRGVEHLFTTYFPQPLPSGRLLGTA